MDPITAELRTRLEHECRLVRQFIDVLRGESLALEHPDDVAGLRASTEAKHRCADELALAARHRDAILIARGAPAGKDGLDTVGRTDPALAPLCRELLELAGEARRLNIGNGAAIDTYLAHTRRAIHTLRHLAGTGGLYNAKGRATV